MRRELQPLPPPPVWPHGVAVRAFREQDAAAVHSLLERSYAAGGGRSPRSTWLPAMTGDAEFDSEVWFVAEHDGQVIGVALCWTSAFLKDLAVDGAWRKHGLGTALLHHALRAFAGRGASALDLKVESDNPSGAVRLYMREGFVLVERQPV